MFSGYKSTKNKLWHNGEMAQRHNGEMAQRHNGEMAQRRKGNLWSLCNAAYMSLMLLKS